MSKGGRVIKNDSYYHGFEKLNRSSVGYFCTRIMHAIGGL